MSLYEELSVPQVGWKDSVPVGLFIGNEYAASEDGQKIDTFNPATGEKITSFYAASVKDVDRAVKTARDAYENVWSKTSPEDRGKLLYKLSELIERDQYKLAALETLDSGKPYYSNALGDMQQIIQLTKYFAGAADKYIRGTNIPVNKDKYALTFKVPYGVVGQVIPWNYPLAMASWKIQGCLAAGNSIVIKPAENTSLSLLYMAKLFVEAGFPPGVLNVVPGLGSVAGSALAEHPDVEKIAFTGSTKIGQKIMEIAAQSNLKDVTLECGGKSPAVIFADSDLDNAVEWVAGGIFYNSGQNCTSNSRIYVQDTVYEKFLSKFRSHIQCKWKFGPKLDPFDKECTLGPVISEVQYKKIRGYVDHGSSEEELRISKLGDFPTSSKGYFIPPIFFTDVPQTSTLNREEIFGPVAVISKFKDYEEAIKLANDTPYGLASAVFTENLRVANRFVRDIKAGTVWVNSSNDEEISVEFGGFKSSGIGRELGESGVSTYCQTKAAHFNISDY